MNQEILNKFEFKQVRKLLNAVQHYTDRMIYSKESAPSEVYSAELEKLLDPAPISNGSIKVVLQHVHINLVGMARELLPIE